MSAKETITKLNEQREAFISKLIEKYEAEIKRIEDLKDKDTHSYYGVRHKIAIYNGFISDLKQLQQNTVD